MINLRYWCSDNGNCRVYYKQGRRLYCWQLVTPGKFELLTCSRDGEPECPVRPECIGPTPYPPFKNAEPIARELRIFLAKREETTT